MLVVVGLEENIIAGIYILFSHDIRCYTQCCYERFGLFGVFSQLEDNTTLSIMNIMFESPCHAILLIKHVAS